MMKTQSPKYHKTVIAWVTAIVVLLIYTAISHAIAPAPLQDAPTQAVVTAPAVTGADSAPCATPRVEVPR